MAFDVKITLGAKFKRFQKVAEGSPQVMQKMFLQWTRIFAAYIRRRFARASRGDGTWKSLSLITIARRRKNSDSILRDTNLLFSQLTPELVVPSSVSKSGQIFKATATFGGSANYPSGVTVTDVMRFHQVGGKKLPQRKIIVDPDPKTRDQMIRSSKRIVTDSLNGK